MVQNGAIFFFSITKRDDTYPIGLIDLSQGSWEIRSAVALQNWQAPGGVGEGEGGGKGKGGGRTGSGKGREEWEGEEGAGGGGDEDNDRASPDSSSKLLMELRRCISNEALPDSMSWILLTESEEKDEMLSC